MLTPAPLLSAELCVIASSSSANCSLLRVRAEGHTYVILIDAGLSPRRTNAFLAASNIAHIDHVLLTHLDSDHWHNGWLAHMPAETTIHIHKRHRSRAERCGLSYLKTSLFESSFSLIPGLTVHPLLVAHDDLGAAAFVLHFTAQSRKLGYATDTGTPTPTLCDHLRGVDVLAIESNYCPQMQLASTRPDFLKSRIMGGRGHLSNQQSARAVAAIAPKEALILLHLSRECNSRDAATLVHTANQTQHKNATHPTTNAACLATNPATNAGNPTTSEPYRSTNPAAPSTTSSPNSPKLIIAHADTPTPWVRIVDPQLHPHSPPTTQIHQANCFQPLLFA